MRKSYLLFYAIARFATSGSLTPFLTAECIPANDLLGFLGVLAETDLTHKAAEHIRKIPGYELGALDVTRADRAGVKLNTYGTRRIDPIGVTFTAEPEILTFPPIADHHLLTLTKNARKLSSAVMTL